MSVVKTSELTGFQLDLAVAKAEGEQAELDHGEVVTWKTIAYHEYRLVWRPSTDWSQGGAIIEREKMRIAHNFDEHIWEAGWDCHVSGWGDTPLIAAMRCYVASKLGDEVGVQDEVVA